MLIGSISLFFAAILFFAGFLLLPPSLLAMAQQQQQQTTTTGGAATPSLTPPLPLTPIITPPLTPEEQAQQIRLQNVIASTTLNLQETEKQVSGIVFTPRWSQPIWINANSVAVLAAYCLPGEFADSGQEILGGFELEVLESYAVALPQGFMAWMAVVGNEDIQNGRFPAALGVICASDLNNAEARVLSPEEQQQINNINEQFVNIQNTQITDIDNVINIINNVTTNQQNATGGGMTPPQQQDTIPPVLIVPETLTVNATSAEGAVVTFAVTAQDNVDGAATLEADGITITKVNYTVVMGEIEESDISISCYPRSGSIFPIGPTNSLCTATDSSGNEATESFDITVIDPASTADATLQAEEPATDGENTTSATTTDEGGGEAGGGGDDGGGGGGTDASEPPATTTDEGGGEAGGGGGGTDASEPPATTTDDGGGGGGTDDAESPSE
jgi:hypothetical protein